MYYTIRQMAEMFGVTEHTLRYYTDLGLLPCERDGGNRRMFNEESVNWMQGIKCLKGCGASIGDIQDYCRLCLMEESEENLRALLAACAEAGVYGIITFGFGVTLREGGREYFYRALDARFPGLKDEYVRRYGNAYVCESPNSARLTEILRRDCARYGIRCDTDGLFAYLRELPARQVSLFASI